jgi:hypothetical protein
LSRGGRLGPLEHHDPRALRTAGGWLNTIAPVAMEDYRRASYEIWQAMAAGWDRERSWMWEASRAVSENLLEALDVGGLARGL